MLGSTGNVCQSPIVCDWCDEDFCELWFCRNCACNLCDTCKQDHAKKIKFQTHSVVLSTGAIRQRYSEVSDVTESHNGHSSDRISEIAQNEVQNYKDTLLLKCQLKQKEVKQHTIACKNWFSSVEKDVNIIRKGIKDKIDNRCDEILQAANKKMERTISHLSDKEENLQKIEKNLKTLQTEDSLHANFRNMTECNKMNEKLQEIKNISHLRLPKFKPGRIDDDQMFAMIGGIEDFKVQPHLVETVLLSKSKHYSRLCSIRPGIVEDAVWLTEKGKCLIKLVKVDGQVLNFINTPKMVNDFVVLNSSHMLTSHYNQCSINKISQDGRYTLLINTSPYRPSGLCLSTNNQNIIASLSHPDGSTKLSVYDRNGENLHDYRYTNKRGSSRPVQRVALNQNGDIVVLHWNLDTVFVLDNRGALKFTYNGGGIDSFDPYDVCCDAACRILISDRENKVLMLDQHGKLIGVIMREEIKTPSAICVTNGRLCVGCSMSDLAVLEYGK